jgi:hypothetical protein
MTILDHPKTGFIRFASGEVDAAFAHTEPWVSPWHREVYFASPDGVVARFKYDLVSWREVTADIHRPG